MENFQIEKKEYGSYRWCVVKHAEEWPYRVLIRKCRTKKIAALVKRIFDGDASAVPEWYRLKVNYALKEFSTEKEAYRSAVLSAHTMGLTPIMCKADHETGIPY
ncbi:MAG: hypothetical protein ACYTFK_13895 [Planctomycetota bacterium]|jgi:hypothetical protein